MWCVSFVDHKTDHSVRGCRRITHCALSWHRANRSEDVCERGLTCSSTATPESMQARAAAALAELRAISCSLPMTQTHCHCWWRAVNTSSQTAREQLRTTTVHRSAWHVCTLFLADSTAPMVWNRTTSKAYARYAWDEGDEVLVGA